MDLQKHKFWVVVGAVAVAEFGGLAYCMLKVDAEISKQSKGLAAASKELEALAAKDAIPNETDAAETSRRKKGTAQSYVRTMFYLAMRDAMALERTWKDGNKEITDVSDLKPLYASIQADLRKKMVEAADPYTGLIIKEGMDAQGRPVFPVKFPDAPIEKPEVEAFYRNWWVLEMALHQIIAPAAKQAAEQMAEADRPAGRWELLELEVMTHEQVPGAKQYLNEYIPVRMRLKMQQASLKSLMQTAFNTTTSFFVVPQEVGGWMGENDPDEIKIIVPPGATKPTDDEMNEMASKKQPKIIVELTLNVIDLDQQKLLDLARVHKDKIGSERSDLEAFANELNTDDFCKAQQGFDRKDFLNRMVDKLVASR